MKSRITRNRARCRSCGQIIESRSRHDYVTCKCGKVTVDGGLAYLKRGGSCRNIEELSEYDDDLADNLSDPQQP